MTDQFRRTPLLPASAGWLRNFLLFLAAITALPLYAGPAANIKGRAVSIHDERLAALTEQGVGERGQLLSHLVERAKTPDAAGIAEAMKDLEPDTSELKTKGKS